MKSIYERMEKFKQLLKTDFCELFDLHDDEKIQAYLMKIRNTTHSDFGLSYQTVLNNQSYAIRSGNVRPCQFVVGNIPTISEITDTVGRGWNDKKIARFFDENNKVGYGQKEVLMTNSKHYEHEYILLSTMKKIKLTTNKDKGHLFTIECYMPSFEPQNETVRIQHVGMFKHDKYTFHPQKRVSIFHAI
jgi:hypothetical protein